MLATTLLVLLLMLLLLLPEAALPLTACEDKEDGGAKDDDDGNEDVYERGVLEGESEFMVSNPDAPWEDCRMTPDFLENTIGEVDILICFPSLPFST